MSRPTSVDVAVVGAGAIGCAIAWRLGQAGLSVRLVEKTRPGAEASSAAAGILAAQVEGADDGPLFRALRRSERMYQEFATEVRQAGGLDPGWRRCGAVVVAADEREAAETWDQLAWQAQAGFALERLAGPALRAREPALGPDVREGVLFPEAAQIDAQRLTPALLAAATAAGCQLQIGTVQRLLIEAGGVTGIEVDGEALAASTVVVAGGAWSTLLEGVGLPAETVRPVRGQLVRFDLAPPLRGIVFGAGGYLVPRVEGHVLGGSTMEAAGFDKSVTQSGVHAILERAARLCPALGAARIGALWAGLRPACPDDLPALGPVPTVAGLHLAVGHLRNGILLTPLTAEIVTAGVLGRAHDLAPELAAARLFEG